VTERTRELADRNREIAAMLNSMQQGIFTIDETLAIQPQHSEHLTRLLGTKELAGKDCLQMLFRGSQVTSNVGPDALDAMRCALQFGFGVAHLAEEACDDLRRNREAARDAQPLLAGIDAVLAAISEHEGVCQRKLGSLAHGHAVRLEQEVAEIRASISGAARSQLAPAQALRDIEEILARGGAVPFSELVAQSARMLPSLARELRKGTPRIDVLCQDDTTSRGLDDVSDVKNPLRTMVTPQWSAILRDVLVHGLRNAIDHGIEGEAERQARGKEPQGRIRIHVERHGGGAATIRLCDDGRGLPLAALRERLEQLDGQRQRSSDEELAERAFQSGVSTAPRLSAISGRGVGLDAIRSFLRRQKGEARIVFTGPAEGDGRRPFELVIELPDGAVLLDRATSGDATVKRASPRV
jgi:two-component system chemotaxis sensor kinase CheA